jgi:tetraprenyl-beta-curcumene synthase
MSDGAGRALLRANLRYWSSILHLTRAQLRRWECRAQLIPDPELQALALAKLQDERFNSEVAATLATLAPRRQRGVTVEAIVALQVMYDFLDGLTERPTADPLEDGLRLFGAFIDALAPRVGGHDYYDEPGYYGHGGQPHDGGYLEELSAAVRTALARMPSWHVVADVATQSATRCAEAQVRAHAAAVAGPAQLEAWALAAAVGTDLQWREFLAGAAASVLAVHALIGAASQPHITHEQAATLDSVYLPICTLSTMLDSLVDHQQDVLAGELGFIQYYEDPEQLARKLADAARLAGSRARALPDGGHHTMTMAGVVAYYLSAPTAGSELARPVRAALLAELSPLITPTLAIMRCWRMGKRLHRPGKAPTEPRSDLRTD